jgi:hypothetical protein
VMKHIGLHWSKDPVNPSAQSGASAATKHE